MQQKKVVVYSFKICPYCIKAKNLLKKEKIVFEEIIIKGKELEELSKKTNMTTVPQILVDGKLIGGYDDLYKLYCDRQKFNEVFKENI